MLNIIKIVVLSFVVFLTVIINNCYAQTVVISTPATGTSYTIGSSIAVTGTASAPPLNFVSSVVVTVSTASVTATGTTSYSASLPTTGLTPGTYTLTVTNNYSFLATGLFSGSKTTTISVTLNQAAPIITYATPQVYTTGATITTLSPTVTNGVSAIGFGSATALTGATLNNPRGIAIDASGNVYVTNSGNNTISKYSSSGTYIGTFGTGATMSFPKDIVFDSSGNAYVLNLGATAGTGSVYKYNSSGVYQSTILSGLNYALGLTIDASDNIYVADQGAVTVKKYTTSGALLLSLPTANLSTPLGVAVDASGNIYVLNNGTGNVTKYNSAGTFISTFLTGYTSAQAITIDGAGNIYIGDNAATNTVYVYNQSGTLLTSKAVTDPEGIAVDSKGVIFTSAYFANQVNKSTPTGGYFLNKTLPAGLSFNSSTGAISGTPTATMTATVYTVTAYNAGGSGNTTVTITVNPTAPTGTGGSTCPSGTVALTASGSSPAGGVYTWYAALSGGTSLFTGATYTTPILTATTTYYVDYTQGGTTSTPRTAVIATVNAPPAIATVPTSPTASLYLSYPFTGNANDVSGNSNNGTLQNAPLLIADRYGAANSAYSFNGSTQYISTATSVASPGPQNFSISVWFKTSSAGGKLVGFGSSQTGLSSPPYDRHIYMNNSGQLYFGLHPGGTANTINTTASYADGVWHHVVATESTTNGANLYVDGVLQDSDPTMTSSGVFAGYWRVAYDNLGTWPSAPTSNYFNGALDDIAVYKTELTASQVYTLYGGGSAPVCAGSTLSLQANTVSGATYSWSGPNSFTSSSQNPTIANATASNAGTYVLTVTGSNGCTSQLNVTATINSAPVLATAPTTPTAGLYLSYPFTGNANDVSGNSNNGTLQNAPSLVADRYGAAGSAYSFNGSTQYISTATAVASPGPQNFSISVWFKTSSPGGKLVGFGAAQTGSSGSYDRHIYMNNSGQIYFGVWPTTSPKTINTTTTYADGNWHHAVATLSTTNGANLYVDGALMATDATITSSGAYSGYWRVGYDNLGSWTSMPTDFFFNGSLDDIAIYNTELTASQVYTLYGGGSTPVCSGSTLSLQANTVSGATYSWSGPNSFTSTSQNPTIASATSVNAGIYTVTVTAASGCTSQLSVTGVVNAAPSAAFTATSSVSVNSNANITYTGTDPSTSTYSWNFNGGTPATGTGQGPFSVQWATSGTKTITLTVTNASGCSAVSTQSVNVVGAYGNYAFQDLITLNTTSLGITSNLTNFPALLSIQDNDLIISGTCADKVQNPNGPNYDLAFVSGGSELYYQIENYNQTTGTLLVWVQIPTLTFAANNSISLYFGSKSPTITHNAAFFANTWASNYLAVFHFNEASYTGSVADGTAGGHTGTTGGMTSADLVTGKIGTAYTFDGSSKKITTNAVSVTGPFTISAWVKLGATGLDQKVITNQSAAAGASGGYKLGVYNTNIPESESGIATNRASTPNPTAFATGAWHYIQSVYTGSTLSTYVDGAQYKVLTTGNNPSANANLYIGVGEGGTILYFNGIIDEPRVSNVAKTADWIKAEYGDQNNPSAFTTVGATTTNSTNAAAIPGALTYTWTGATSTNPSVAGNWNNTTAGTTNQLPAFDGTATLVIPAGLSNYPSLTAPASLYGLTIASGASLNLNGQILSVGCNIYNNANTGGTGILDGSSSTTSGITFNGQIASQKYTGTNTTSTDVMGNMTINNTAGGTVTITGGPVEISNLLTLTQGNVVIDNTNNGALTLKGNASSSLTYAQIDQITPGYTISGNINYQVYFTGGAGYRNYRSMASPVYNNTSTYSSTNGTYTLASLKTSFIITGSGGATNGFDASSNNGSTLKLYNTATSNYTFITSLNSAPTVASGTAFYMYFRGSRTPAGTVTAADPFGSKTNKTDGGGFYATADPVMYTYTGVPNQGSLAAPAFAATDSRFYYLANPYAATLDANAIINSALVSAGVYYINNKIWIWSPSAANYAIYSLTAPLSVNGGKRYIVPGQGFFVQAATTGTAKTLTITEAMKSVANSSNAARFLYQAEPLAVADPPIFRLKFVKDSILSDEIAVAFIDSAKATIDNNDATHLEGSSLTLSSLTADNQYLAIDVRPFTGSSTVMPLYITPDNDTTYSLKLSYKNTEMSNYKILLADSLLNKTTDISNNSYLFSVTPGVVNTYGKRFKLIIQALPAPPLFTKFAGQLNELKKVLLNWNGGTDRTNINYQVQRSTNRSVFTNIGQPLTGNSNINYQTIDNGPAIGMNYYRLAQTDAFNNTIYSDTIAIANNPGLLNGIAKNGFVLYPNAVSDIVSVVGDKTYQGTVKLRIYDNLGKMQASQSFTEMNAQVPIQEDISNLKMGVYTARIDNNNNEIVVIKFIKK